MTPTADFLKKSLREVIPQPVAVYRVQLHKAPIFRGFLLFGNNMTGLLALFLCLGGGLVHIRTEIDSDDLGTR